LDRPVIRKLVELLDKNGSTTNPDLVYRADSKGLGYAFLDQT
jgi:hypothetical protein